VEVAAEAEVEADEEGEETETVIATVLFMWIAAG